MDLRHILPLVVIGGSFAFTGTILYGAWLLGRYRGREERNPAELENIEARLHRLEHVVAQATGAVERLEAAHRLTARLIVDNAPAAGTTARALGRVVTPH